MCKDAQHQPSIWESQQRNKEYSQWEKQMKISRLGFPQ